jgi:phosphoribosyl-ATP pyrophosphohydrolase
MQILSELYATILARKEASAEASYTAKLLERGSAHIGKKLGEEGVELAIAAAQNDRSQVVYESADVLYHLLVLLAAQNIPLTEIEAELARREAMSGLAEKAARGD